MSTGIVFSDILVSPITMVLAVIVFLLCCWLLLFKRKTISSGTKTLVVFGIIITGIYIAFIVWAVIGFGGGFR
ncbi:MAG: hypothetical protein E7488_00590 [Ruminococcaceae bacterium]|nr:hypothetical protein [Oscillospiraceae bacterium]